MFGPLKRQPALPNAGGERWEIDLMRVKGQDRSEAVFEALGFHDEKTSPNMERARHSRDNPPPEDWDGVWTLTQK